MGFPSKQRDCLVLSLSPLDGKKSPWMCSAPERQNPTRFYPRPYAKRPLLSRRHKTRRKNKRTIMNRVPCAPYNTSSYLMRAGKLGINAPLLSPATPALETPVISPSPWPSESLGDCQVANELGVNAYGSMNGRIRLRSDDMDRDSGSCSCGESDTEHCGRRPADSVQQVEERIDHGLQRFEMLYNADSPLRQHGVVADQEIHIQHLEEENLSLQQRLWAMSQELSHLRRRLGHDCESGVISDESLGNGSSRINFKWRCLSAAAQAMEIPSGVESTCSHLLSMPRPAAVKCSSRAKVSQRLLGLKWPVGKHAPSVRRFQYVVHEGSASTAPKSCVDI